MLNLPDSYPSVGIAELHVSPSSSTAPCTLEQNLKSGFRKVSLDPELENAMTLRESTPPIFKESARISSMRQVLAGQAAQEFLKSSHSEVRAFGEQVRQFVANPILDRDPVQLQRDLVDLKNAATTVNRLLAVQEGGPSGVDRMLDSSQTIRQVERLIRHSLAQEEVASPEHDSRRQEIWNVLKVSDSKGSHLPNDRPIEGAKPEQLDRLKAQLGYDPAQVLLRMDPTPERQSELVASIKALVNLGDPTLVLMHQDFGIPTRLGEALRRIEHNMGLPFFGGAREAAREGRRVLLEPYLYDISGPTVEDRFSEILRDNREIRRAILERVPLEASYNQAKELLESSNLPEVKDAFWNPEGDEPQFYLEEMPLRGRASGIEIKCEGGPDHPGFGLILADRLDDHMRALYRDASPVLMAKEDLWKIQEAVEGALDNVKDDGRLIECQSQHAAEIRRQQMIQFLEEMIDAVASAGLYPKSAEID